MTELGKKARIKLHWKVSPYDYSKERVDTITAKLSKKYNLPKDRIKVVPIFQTKGENGEDEVSVTSDIIQNIQEPKFQLKLFKDYLELNEINDCDFDLIEQIDSSINAKIDYQIYDKFRRYGIKWIKWDNFLSYGANNYFDFSSVKGLVSLTGENQSGKTTLSIDLIHFLLFGKTTKVPTQDKIFNKHLQEATNVVVEGCITIDNVDYIIKRTLSRPSLEKRTSKSKTTQKVEYYKIVGDTMEVLEDYDDNLQQENTHKTNKVIKEAVGKEDDFDLIMCVTEPTIDDLVNKKEAERGRLLARWIGLLPIEEKNTIAREIFNSDIKPKLVSNVYNEETIKQDIEAYKIEINRLKSEIETFEKDNIKIDEELVLLEAKKSELIASKKNINQDLVSIDLTTLNKSIENANRTLNVKKNMLYDVEKILKELGAVEFSMNEYDKLTKQLSFANQEIAAFREGYKSTKSMITQLKSSEYCPTCGRKLEGVDNSSKIAEMEERLKELEKNGKEKGTQIKAVEAMIESMKAARENYEIVSKKTIEKSALEVNIERINNELKELLQKKKDYDENADAIIKNNEIDINIRNNDVFINSKRSAKERNLSCIAIDKANIKTYSDSIEEKTKIISKIKEEEHLVKNWKIYLELVGKDGISKMVLRKALPIINGRLSEYLSDVCDFDVEVTINNKNDVMFNLIKDGVYSDLSSGSGFELTASGIALRAVLSELSTIPKSSILTLDEVWGRVAKTNYDNMKTLMEKVAKDYQAVLLISHLDEVKDMCSTHISVVKENNISKLVLK